MADNELTSVRAATPERGFKIPPPKDPKAKAEWEAAVAKRKASGAGMFVGDSAASICDAVKAMCDSVEKIGARFEAYCDAQEKRSTRK